MDNLLSDTFAVILKTKEGKIFQVALDDKMHVKLKNDLSSYFKKGIIQVLPDEISTITINDSNIKKS